MLNMNFKEVVVIETEPQDWVASPMSGVWRKPLAREAVEHGHTTSVVRFDAGSYFSPHLHPLGEEIFVLDGVFSDETGDYSAGTYLRHPPGSSHKPFSRDGCVIFVKLDQFQADDEETVRVNTVNSDWLPGEGRSMMMPLHENDYESVSLMKYPAHTRLQPHRHFGGEEIFVLSGVLKDEWGVYPAGTWLRNPHDSEHCPYVEEETVVWMKSGHLPI